jgi:tetrahydromethanopterin S-methyltransferase subunit B
MFAPLLKNLGIIFDDKLLTREKIKVKNADLYQGQEYINYNDQRLPKVFKRLPFLQVSSMPGLFSINEAMNGSDSIKGNDTVLSNNKNITTDIVKNENDFNKSLSEYATLQQNLEDSNLYHKVDAAVTTTILNKLAVLNAKLIKHAKNINADMSKLNVTDSGLKQQVVKQQNHLNDYIQTLDKQSASLETVNGMDETTKLSRTANTYHYLMWFILLITLLALFLYILTSDLVINTLVVIISLMVIYLLARAINQHTTF